MEPTATAVFLDGAFLDDAARAAVSLFDGGYLVGDGVFETLRGYGGRAFRCGEHLSRLARAAALFDLPLPFAMEEIDAIVHRAIARSGAADAYVRVTLSRGPEGAARPTFSVVARPNAAYSDEEREAGIASGIAALRKVPAACIDPSIKPASYAPHVLARRELARRGMREGVLLTVDGDVVSGASSNVFLRIGGALVTPSLASGCRPGVTRGALLEAARGARVPCEERRVAASELRDADEVFFTNTLMECLPAATFEGRPLDPERPAARALHAALRALIARETRSAA